MLPPGWPRWKLWRAESAEGAQASRDERRRGDLWALTVRNIGIEYLVDDGRTDDWSDSGVCLPLPLRLRLPEPYRPRMYSMQSTNKGSAIAQRSAVDTHGLVRACSHDRGIMAASPGKGCRRRDRNHRLWSRCWSRLRAPTVVDMLPFYRYRDGSEPGIEDSDRGRRREGGRLGFELKRSAERRLSLRVRHLVIRDRNAD